MIILTISQDPEFIQRKSYFISDVMTKYCLKKILFL